jgi:hypothetical protein
MGVVGMLVWSLARADEWVLPSPFSLPGGGRGVVLNPGYQADVCKRQRKTATDDCTFWEPTLKQVRAIDRALIAYLRVGAPVSSPLRKGLSGYFRQFVGVMRGKERHVRIHGFCRPHEAWHELLVEVRGGGHAAHGRPEASRGHSRAQKTQWTVE